MSAEVKRMEEGVLGDNGWMTLGPLGWWGGHLGSFNPVIGTTSDIQPQKVVYIPLSLVSCQTSRQAPGRYAGNVTDVSIGSPVGPIRGRRTLYRPTLSRQTLPRPAPHAGQQSSTRARPAYPSSLTSSSISTLEARLARGPDERRSIETGQRRGAQRKSWRNSDGRLILGVRFSVARLHAVRIHIHKRMH